MAGGRARHHSCRSDRECQGESPLPGTSPGRAKSRRMKEQIAVALIGAGRIGQEHARSLVSIPWVRVEVVCDVRIEAAPATQLLARAASVSDSVEAVLARKDIQAVIVCTSTDTHADLIEASARAGKA